MSNYEGMGEDISEKNNREGSKKRRRG